MGRLMLGISGRRGNVLFVQGDEVAVVLNGLDTFEGGVSRAKRPSILGSGRSGLVNRPLCI
jgi:hypothetical protein